MTQVSGEPRDDVVAGLRTLDERLARTALPLDLPGVEEARRLQRGLVDQLEDYVLPRAERLDAPLLAVVGGSTGAGKSTLVNSLVGQEVSRASAIRPTTRRPVLVHHPDDAAWFTGDRVLPGLARVQGAAPATPHAAEEDPITELGLVAADTVPRGLALLDAPDIDSVVAANRRLATQLLAAADLWIFVTTAARYADAVPWELLREAAARRVVVAVVLDRVPPGTAGEIRADLAERLETEGLAHAPLFVVSEQPAGAARRLPDADIGPVRTWLTGLVADAGTRASVARQTLAGAVAGVLRGAADVAAAARAQAQAADGLTQAAVEHHAAAARAVMEATEDGTLLRGEVLARWQEFVGTGEWLRGVEAAVGRLRDRVAGFLRGRPPTQARAEEAIESGLVTLVVSEVEHAERETRRAWQGLPGGTTALEGLPPRPAAADRPRLAEEVAAEVRDWQRALLERVRAEGEDRRVRARMLSLGVNASGVALMLVVFAFSGGLTGIEVGVAGGTAVVGQKVLEMVFGDQAVRELARHAQRDLGERVDRLLEEHRRPWLERVAGLGVDADAADGLHAAADAVRTGEAGR
ncbi:Dynamin family protein [Georgenia satyanarayanai]|uniref:Dynamin family protein n=1 Tax=Georgenia satyanarayanai TaxID=860221 RepID=A0A2Y8ZY32_9MICO|nr:dynamin family protein [Georgenia satyanarayanai]PYG02094.1 dynamin family protein [Georgenia satyanarayanai]SSA36905.1 Dynamin family protein [Georgenia satyanarayanai]